MTLTEEQYNGLLKTIAGHIKKENELEKTIELNKQAAQNAKKMLVDWFNCANHKLKAYECIEELNKIIGENDE